MKFKNSSFQFLKIVATLLIIAHHLVAKNAFNIDTQVVGITGNKLMLQILGNNAFIGNSLFFLISAWFLSEKRAESGNLAYSKKSCCRIEKTVLFYSCAMYIAMSIFGIGLGKISLLQSIFPTLTGMWWYPTTYMLFLLIWPFYHTALMGFSVENLKQFTAIIFVIWSVSTLFPFSNLGANNFTGFLMLYAIVVVIRRTHITFESHRYKFIGLILVPYGAAIASIVMLDLIGKKIPLAAEYSCYFIRGNFRPVSMMVSIGLFMWGTSWKQKANKVLDYLADTTFGIYLFHMYPPNMKYLFESLFSLQHVIGKWYAVLWAIAVVIVIFTLGVLIDSIRRVLFYGCDFLICRIREKNRQLRS